MSEGRSKSIQFFSDYGIYFPTKTMMMFGDISEENCEAWIKNIHVLDSYPGMISIKLNSGGGDVTQGRALYDAISFCKNQVRIVVTGQASSAASFILQAGDERFMTDNSYLMLHIGEESFPSDHPRTNERWFAYNKTVEEWMEKIYLDSIKKVKPRFTRDKVKKMLLFDTILSPKMALELGLIDEIKDPQ